MEVIAAVVLLLIGVLVFAGAVVAVFLRKYRETIASQAVESSAGDSARQPQLLTPEELRFYHVLIEASDGWATVQCKVHRGDLVGLTGPNGVPDGADRHVDFVLCEPDTMRPLLAVELDETSANGTRPAAAPDDALTAAGLPVLRIRVKDHYSAFRLEQMLLEASGFVKQLESPACPRCGSAMTLHTAKRGRHLGESFWVCSRYPRCQGVLRAPGPLSADAKQARARRRQAAARQSRPR